jgi:hypothetical protein
MKKYYQTKIVTALLIGFLWFSYSIVSLFTNSQALLTAIDGEFTSIFSRISAVVDDSVPYKMMWIESYGFMQKLLFKEEENNFEVIQDTDGKLHYAFFAEEANEVSSIVRTVNILNWKLIPSKADLVVLMPPDKVIEGYTQFSEGLPYSYSNETADNFLLKLEESGISTFDFRDKLNTSKLDKSKIFFNTDHHWTVESGFWAFTELVNYLEDRGYQLDPENFYTDASNYNFITYPESYIGSMGRKTGVLYGGVDDFTLIYPKFTTEYNYTAVSPGVNIETSGRFEDALLNGYAFNLKDYDSIMNADKYFSYLYGNQAFVSIVNQNNPDGIKVLMIKDSMSVPMASFLSTVVKEIVLIDPRYYKEDIAQYAHEEKFDLVLVSIYPPNLTDEFFDYNMNK